MRYDADTHTLHLGRKDCWCEDGTQNFVGPCPKCDGTGKGPRGGARGCKTCYGSGTKVDPTRTMTCTRCHGEPIGFEVENWCDTAPSEMVQALPHKVTRSDRRQSFLESYIGVGLWSVTDYGRAWEANDAESLIAHVRAEETHVQATKVARKTDDERVLQVCDGIRIDVHPNGYTVVGYFADGAPIL